MRSTGGDLNSLQGVLFDVEEDDFEAAHVTFTNSRLQPLHRWYPYLEGYAPQFVQQIFRRFMPKAERVLEPFAGTGTTPLTLAAGGIHCGFAEVNPAMRFVVAAKLHVSELSAKKARQVSDELRDIATSLPERVRVSEPDAGLRLTYIQCFGDSEFFDALALDSVLRLRALNDTISESSGLISDLFAVAVLSQLILCSRLKRAGDVRFKTAKELERGIPEIVSAVQQQLIIMAADCIDCTRIERQAVPLCSDAKDLERLPSYEAHGVITSPPYLNGTNYIRNTKVELWYLRQITNGDGLRMLRDQVVTSGINDVTNNTRQEYITQSVADVVAEVERNAYDQRIPRMVAGYFCDMAIVMRGLLHQTVPGAAICIDIGDSRFGGVHIPTQRLLANVACEIGLEFEKSIRLRNRVAKDRSVLSQDLLVFRHPRSRAVTRRTPLTWRDRWEMFKRELPHQKEPYTKRNWGHPLHSLCSYQGKMKPSLAYHLVACFTEQGESVMDPFSGAGTIPFEAALTGRHAYGLDLSVLALAVSLGKLRRAGGQALSDLLDDLGNWVADYNPTNTELEATANIKFNRPITEYFHEDTLNEILAARSFFAQRRDDSPEWAMALSCMLHILHGNRPYALSRRSHPITPFAPTGEFEYRNVIERLKDKIARSINAELPASFIPGMCWQSDILEPWPKGIPQLDAIITSPPFFDSTRFYMANWMRFWFCGWDLKHFDSEPMKFVETAQKKSLLVYRPILESFHQHLNTGGRVVMHLGASKKCDMAKELAKIAQPMFTVADVFQEDVGHCEKHGISDKGTVHSHQYLVLIKN